MCDLRVGLSCAMWSGLTASHPSDRSHGHLLVRALASREECALDQYQVSLYRYWVPVSHTVVRPAHFAYNMAENIVVSVYTSMTTTLRCQTFRPMPAMWSVPFLHACKYPTVVFSCPQARTRTTQRAASVNLCGVAVHAADHAQPCMERAHSADCARRPNEVVVDGIFRLYAARMMAPSL